MDSNHNQAEEFRLREEIEIRQHQIEDLRIQEKQLRQAKFRMLGLSIPLLLPIVLWTWLHEFDDHPLGYVFLVSAIVGFGLILCAGGLSKQHMFTIEQLRQLGVTPDKNWL